MKINSHNPILNQSGFLAADFLFSFVLVIGCGIIIFALTFSLATVEIAQYITWSAARSYSAGNLCAPPGGVTSPPCTSGKSSTKAADAKFKNLSLKFPLLTGADGSSAWFQLTKKNVGDNAWAGLTGLTNPGNKTNGGSGESRHPWTGVNAELEWKLFKGIKIPFLGKIATDGADTFTFPIRAFLLRNPSQQECLNFYSNRFSQGIKNLEGWNSGVGNDASYVAIEDNGC